MATAEAISIVRGTNQGFEPLYEKMCERIVEASKDMSKRNPSVQLGKSLPFLQESKKPVYISRRSDSENFVNRKMARCPLF